MFHLLKSDKGLKKSQQNLPLETLSDTADANIALISVHLVLRWKTIQDRSISWNHILDLYKETRCLSYKTTKLYPPNHILDQNSMICFVISWAQCKIQVKIWNFNSNSIWPKCSVQWRSRLLHSWHFLGGQFALLHLIKIQWLLFCFVISQAQ